MQAPIPKKSIAAHIRDIFRVPSEEDREMESRPSRVESYRTTLMNLDDYLPQPEEDREIALKLKKLQGLIEMHATSDFYHGGPVDHRKEEILDLLQKRLFKMDEAAIQQLEAFDLRDTSQTATFLRYVIAKTVLSGIDLYGDPATSLLPQEIMLFMNAFKSTPRSNETAEVDDVALCEWRRIGHYLLSSPQSKMTQFQNTGDRIEKMLTSLDEILCPFAIQEYTGADKGSRLKNLRSIVKAATDIGVLFFGQPCGWELDWRLRPTNEAQDVIEAPNGSYTVNPQVPQPQLNTVSEGSQTIHSDVQDQPPPTGHKRRKRLGRRHFRKANDILREKVRKYSELSGENQQRDPPHHQHSSTSNSYSFNEGLGETPPPIPSKDKENDDARQSGQTEHQKRLETRTEQIAPSESSSEGPEHSTLKRESQVPPSQLKLPIVWFPALLKVNDEYGFLLAEPQLVSEPVVDRSVLTAWY